MKKFLSTFMMLAFILTLVQKTSAQTTIVYDFDSGLGLSNISQSSGTSEAITLAGANDNGSANTTNLLHPKTVGSPNQTGVVDFTAFPATADYSVTWKEYLATGATTYKKGILLRGSGTGGYTTAIKQGYLFLVQNNTTTGSVAFRIMNSSASTSITDFKNISVTIAGFAVNKACWFRASAEGNVMTFSYSMDGTNFTTAATYTDASNLYSSGTTQLVYGLASGAGQYYYDNITYTTFSKAATSITVTGSSNYLYNGSPQGPITATVTGSTGVISYAYTGTGPTSYGPSSLQPVLAGSYQAVATVAADNNYKNAVSSPFTFTISPNPNNPVAAMRRPISPTSPMYLLHCDVWADQPQQVIDLIPADMKPYVVINISLSTSILGNKGYACAESWLNTCAQNGIWAMVQVSSGIENAFAADTALSQYESLYKKYPNLIGYNFAEQAWGFNATTFLSRLNLFTNLLAMGQKYGGYLYINDNFSISNSIYNTVAKFKTSPDFANATKVYKDHMIYGDKFTNSYGYYDNESGALGAFLTGHAGNYAIRYDMYSWPFSGRGQVFGTEVVGAKDTTDGNRALFACPEAVMGVPIVEHMMLTGATVIDGPEVPWMSTVLAGPGGKYLLPPFNNMLGDIFRKVMDGTIVIPTANQVAARTKVAFVNDVDYNTTDSLYTNLYAMDGTLKNNRTWFKKSGRYASIPELYSSGPYETSLFTSAVLVKKSAYKTQWPTDINKVSQFNSLYPSEYTGDMYVARTNNSWYAYNPYINTNQSASASIPLKYNTCDSISLSYPAHTFSVINESSNKIQVYLNNYRTDKNQLWTQYPNDFSWAFMQSTLLPSFTVSPWDGTLRTSVIKIYGSTQQPIFTLADRGSHQPSTANGSWSNGIYTLTITHNGPVDITINCSGIDTGRLTPPAPVTMNAVASASVYTGDKEYEAEGGIITTTAAVAKTYSGYSGTGYVTFSNSSAAGSAVGFRAFNVSADSTYQLQTTYSAGSTVTKLDLYINGVKVGSPVFPATPTDSTWAILAQNVKLKAGVDTIQFRANAVGANINIDKITITKGNVPFSFTTVDAVEKNSTQIQVDWRVSAEEHILKYNLQKSANDTTFSTIYTTTAKNTEDSYYVHLDTLSANTCYYKIVATDSTGNITTSNVVKVSRKTAVMFQAESGKLGADWAVATSDVTYIAPKTALLNANYPGDSSKVATYTAKFQQPGSYDLYARFWVGSGNANSDSFFYGNGFGTKNPYANNNDWIIVNNLTDKGYSIENDTVKNTGVTKNQAWEWIDISKFNGGATPISFTVGADTLLRTFQIGSRETGFQIDKFVFGSSDQQFTVKELDSLAGPDNPPVIQHGQSFSVKENADSSSVVGQVIATDPDPGTIFKNWQITGGTGAGYFKIDSLSGQITVAHSNALNFERDSIYALDVKVSDGFIYSAVDSVAIKIIKVKKTQTITFPSLVSKLPGDTVTLNAIATSSLPVTYTSSDTTVATISGNRVHIIGPGQSTIIASQSGDSFYLAATNVQQVLTVDSLNLKLQYTNNDTNPTDNVIKPQLNIINNGGATINYSDLTIKYWFTPENYAGINTWIDYAQIGSGNVGLTYKNDGIARTGSLGYLEYSFSNSAGILAPHGQSGPIESRAANSNWANFNQTDDYSYMNTTSTVQNPHITLYRNGVLVSGTEPATVASNRQVTASIQTVNMASTTNAISNYIKINNIGNVALNYGDLTFRYWFTADGTSSLIYWLDYAKLGNSNINGSFTTLNPALNLADSYLEVHFSGNAGTLYPLSSTGNIQHRISKSNWSNFNQSNDYSFSGSTSFVTSNKITVYYQGALIYGVEPSGNANGNVLAAMQTNQNNDPQINTIYPNPVTGNVFNVKTTPDLYNQLVVVKVLDLGSGRTLLNKTFRNSPDGNFQVNTNLNLRIGVYFVQLNNLPMMKLIVAQ